jgi:5'-3' exonuclease
MPYDYMIIDAKNNLYRAIYAGLSESYPDPPKNSPITIFFRFINYYCQRFKPTNVLFFWDDKKEKIWRRKIYPEYKEGRSLSQGKYDPKLVENFLHNGEIIIKEMIKELGCRNFQGERQEADDLIYAFCKVYHGKKMIIISSDGDFKQIIYHFKHIDLFSPNNQEKKMYEVENEDPIEIKCLMGENGDNIPGYERIGPIKAKLITHDVNKKKELFEKFGEEIYWRNKVLIDLSICPFLLLNMKSIHNTMMENIEVNEKSLRDIIQKYKVKGMILEVPNLMQSFRRR